MNTVKTYLTIPFAVCLICVMASLAEAGAVKIWPDKFRTQSFLDSSIADNDERYSFWGYAITGAKGNLCYFWAPVALPVGKTVTGFIFYTKGNSQDAFTSATLYRIKMGSTPQQMAQVTSSGNSVLRSVTDSSITNATVKSIYRYYVELYVDNEYSAIYGVKVNYK